MEIFKKDDEYFGYGSLVCFAFLEPVVSWVLNCAVAVSKGFPRSFINIRTTHKAIHAKILGGRQIACSSGTGNDDASLSQFVIAMEGR